MTNCHTMAKAKIAITLDAALLGEIDALVDGKVFRNRSQVIERAVADRLERHRHRRLAAECAKLDPREEAAFADADMARDAAQWPRY